MVDRSLINAILSQAQMMTAYFKALINEGMTPKDALSLTIAYQDSNIKAATMAEVEREKIRLTQTKFQQ